MSVPADATLVKLLRANPPTHLADEPVEVTDLLDRDGRQRTDALIYSGQSVRVAIRPSGTEPKVKAYLEIRLPPRDDVATAREVAARMLDDLRADVVGLLQRGPN
jgi:phosphomannomutase